MRASRCSGAKRSAASSTSSARWWSRRSPPPPLTTVTRVAPAASAYSSASSRSVASLAAGWRSMRTPARLGRAHRLGARRVEVADQHVDGEPERGRVLEPRIGCDHERALRQRPHLGGVGSRAAADHEGAPRCCRRRLHGPSVPGSRRARCHARRSAARRRRAARGATGAR